MNVQMLSPIRQFAVEFCVAVFEMFPIQNDPGVKGIRVLEYTGFVVVRYNTFFSAYLHSGLHAAD